MIKIAASVFVLLLALAAAEKYAMVFGTANGWDNYSIASVGYIIYFKPRIHVGFTQI